MVPGRQPGPSKRDGSLLTFLGSPTAKANQPAAKPVVTPKPPPAAAPDPTLKDPVSRFNKIYYDLVFTIKAWGELDAMSIQCLYLTEFITSIRRVDATTVLLPNKSFSALKEEVLHDSAKLG